MPTLCLKSDQTFRLASSNGLITRLCQLIGHSDAEVTEEATQTILSLARDGQPHLISGLNFQLSQSSQLRSVNIVIEFSHLTETTELLASSLTIIRCLALLLNSPHHSVVNKSLHALALLTEPEQGRVNIRKLDIADQLEEFTRQDSEGKRWAAQVLRRVSGQSFLRLDISKS